MLEYLQETTFEYHRNIEEIRFDRMSRFGRHENSEQLLLLRNGISPIIK